MLRLNFDNITVINFFFQSLVYFTFAALGGDPLAQMALVRVTDKSATVKTVQ